MKLDSGGLIKIYQKYFCRKSLYKFNKGLYFLSLSGLGIGNWETPAISGEKHFLTQFTKAFRTPIVLDIGANIGSYSNLIKTLAPQATIYAFEPHPQTFKKLSESALQFNYEAVNYACSDTTGSGLLFDHKGVASESGTEHASLLQNVIETVHSGESDSRSVEITTVDTFVEQHGLDRIDLLKIDVEGGEMNVLKGARKCLERGAVDVVHFEFTQASIVSRVFMKDFVDLLVGYNFYRMVPDGLVSLGVYYSPIFEIFAYQNIVAIRKEADNWAS